MAAAVPIPLPRMLRFLNSTKTRTMESIIARAVSLNAYPNALLYVMECEHVTTRAMLSHVLTKLLSFVKHACRHEGIYNGRSVAALYIIRAIFHMQ